MPRTPDAPETRTITVAVPVADADTLAQLAREDHRSLGAYIQIILHNYLAALEAAAAWRPVVNGSISPVVNKEIVLGQPQLRSEPLGGIHPLLRRKPGEKS